MQSSQSSAARGRSLRVGEIVEVRSEREILATLDQRGELDSLPFMPEMLRFCGRRFRVGKVALKLCDTITWSGLYRMQAAVHLEDLRCDGQAHGGCQAGCLLYWKEAWLRRVDAGDDPEAVSALAVGPAEGPAGGPGLTVAALVAATRKDPNGDGDGERFACQATELLRASSGMVPPWDAGQYVRDVRSGNFSAPAALRAICLGVFNQLQDLSRRVLPRWLRFRGGRRYPFIAGRLTRTPHAELDLRPGELVRVKSREEIVRTLDTGNRNRGMTFDAEMLKHCGQPARVLRRVERLIDERSGRMVRLNNPCIVLEGVICESDYHRLCPRGIYPYWREIWLERLEEPRA